jgi:hypothetical protein
VYSLVVGLLARMNPVRFFSRSSEAMLTAFATSSSNATLPTSLRVAEQNLGIRREIGSLAAALGGLDAVVFTGGIGENAPVIRSRVCRDAAWLGVEIDEAANAAGRGRLSAGSSRVGVWVIPTNEELMMHAMRRLLGALIPKPFRSSRIDHFILVSGLAIKSCKNKIEGKEKN